MSGESHQSWASERLLEAAKLGDRDALGELTLRYRTYLMAVATRTLGDGQRRECSSVVQEGLAKAYEHFSRFRGATTNELLSWLAAIVANEARDRLGAKRLTPIPTAENGDGVLADSLSTPSTQVSRRERAAKLLDASSRLSPDYREVIDLRFFHDMSYEEIATRMGRSNAAVRKIAERALKKLRDDLGEDL
jgi:RNA polymerase sigma-70 factor (ECF subfamily)